MRNSYKLPFPPDLRGRWARGRRIPELNSYRRHCSVPYSWYLNRSVPACGTCSGLGITRCNGRALRDVADIDGLVAQYKFEKSCITVLWRGVGPECERGASTPAISNYERRCGGEKMKEAACPEWFHHRFARRRINHLRLESVSVNREEVFFFDMPGCYRWRDRVKIDRGKLVLVNS